MRIERHQVAAATVAAARDDFANRIAGLVHSMSRAGRMTDHEWNLISHEFLDYLGALSVDTPHLDTPEAKAALADATEAAAGAVAYAAYHPDASFQVFLTYVNFGMSYDREPEGEQTSVTAGQWLDAFCLAVLTDKAEYHGEAFHFARSGVPAEQSRAARRRAHQRPGGVRHRRHRGRRRGLSALRRAAAGRDRHCPGTGTRRGRRPSAQRGAARPARPGRRGPRGLQHRTGRPAPPPEHHARGGAAPHPAPPSCRSRSPASRTTSTAGRRRSTPATSRAPS